MYNTLWANYLSFCECEQCVLKKKQAMQYKSNSKEVAIGIP